MTAVLTASEVEGGLRELRRRLKKAHQQVKAQYRRGEATMEQVYASRKALLRTVPPIALR